MYPGDKSGSAKEVIRCRCVLLQRARWELDEEELNILKERAEFYGLDKSKNFEDFKNKYLKAVENIKTSNYSHWRVRKMLSNEEFQEVEKADNKVIEILKHDFKGYNPAPFVESGDSECFLCFEEQNNNQFKVSRSVSNVAIKPGDDHVDIGNPYLANSIHERVHDIVNLISMAKVNIKDGDVINLLQYTILDSERKRIAREVYINCFDDETYLEIIGIVKKELGERATYNGEEFISEAIVDYYGKDKPSNISKKVYNYLKKEWKKNVLE